MLLAAMLLVAAFFAGWHAAELQADRAIRESQQAAELATQKAVQARVELEALRPREPCHPGCFPAGTLVQAPQCARPIERIRVGEEVVTFAADQVRTSARVVSVFRTRNRLIWVHTDRGDLETTRTQPICLVAGEFRAAGELTTGDTIRHWVGVGWEVATVRRVAASRDADVFNLVLGEPTTFVAGDFLVRSKPPSPGDKTSRVDAASP